MSYIDSNFMYFTRAYLYQKSKYYEEKWSELIKPEDVYLGNGLFISDGYILLQCEYMNRYGDVCEIVGKAQMIDNYRRNLSTIIKK